MSSVALQETSTAYDVLAPAYGLLSDPAAYDRWLDGVLHLARRHGLRSHRVLDVACGDGCSFLPLLRRGFEVVACDISPRMVELAHHASAGAAAVLVADMRSLPRLGSFPLVTCLNDAINHLTSRADVRAAFRGMRANLRADGLLVFDVNTLAAYARRGDVIVEDDERFVAWRATESSIARAGGRTAVLVEIFTRRLDGAWERTTSRYAHRHYPLEDVGRLLGEAGLRVIRVYGQRPGGFLEDSIDEGRHHKALFVAAPVPAHADRR